MAKVIYVVLLLALICGPISVVRAAGDGDIITTSSTTTTTEPPATTTSTTEEPITTTTEKKTTTEPTTTEPTTTTSTTTPASTTTESTSTTTPAPPAPITPVPEPQHNHWVVKNDTKFCLIVDMNLQVNFTYKTEDNATKTALFDVPTNGKVVGKCSSNMAMVDIMGENFEMKIYFNLNETTKQYDMITFLMLTVNKDQLPGAAETQNITLKFSYNEAVPQGKSYHCNRQQKLNATQIIDDDNSVTYPAHVLLSQAQWQAFHAKDTETYDLAKDCDANDTPDIVPIAVGCALAALVVIVLLGYLVGRRRSQNRGGYLSM